jgi:hypothetical protein
MMTVSTRWITFASAALLTWVCGSNAATGLRVEQVAPASAIGVFQVTDAAKMLDALQMHGLLLQSEHEDLATYLREMAEGLPSGMTSSLNALMDAHDPIEVLSSLSLGVVAWVDRSEREEGQIAIAGWIDLGDGFEVLAPTLDSAWTKIRESPDVVTETVLGREADRIGKASADDDGGRMPATLWHVREERLILMGNTRVAIERLLDAVDGTELDDTLENSDEWPSVHSMLDGPQSMMMAVFIERAFEAGALFDSMGVSSMIRASYDAAIGPVRAVALAGGPVAAPDGLEQSDMLLEWSAALWMPEGQGGLLQLLSANTPRAALPSWVGPDVVAMSRLNMSFKHIPDWLRSVVASNPMLMGVGQMLDQSEPAMRAMLGPLGRRMQTIQTLARPITVDSFQSVQVIECSDPQSLADAIAASAPKANMEPREFQGHQIWSVDLGDIMPVPGIGGGRLSVSVAGGSVLVGSDAGVESVLRGLSSRDGGEPAWLRRVLGWLPDEPLAAWGGWDLPETMTAMAEIERLTVKKWEDKIKSEDPELWEEIRGELVDEDRSDELERLSKITEALGAAGWWVKSSTDGFRAKGVMFTSPK